MFQTLPVYSRLWFVVLFQYSEARFLILIGPKDFSKELKQVLRYQREACNVFLLFLPLHRKKMFLSQHLLAVEKCL